MTEKFKFRFIYKQDESCEDIENILKNMGFTNIKKSHDSSRTISAKKEFTGNCETKKANIWDIFNQRGKIIKEIFAKYSDKIDDIQVPV